MDGLWTDGERNVAASLSAFKCCNVTQEGKVAPSCSTFIFKERIQRSTGSLWWGDRLGKVGYFCEHFNFNKMIKGEFLRSYVIGRARSSRKYRYSCCFLKGIQKSMHFSEYEYEFHFCLIAKCLTSKLGLNLLSLSFQTPDSQLNGCQ